jgi:hypothetical protein
MRGAIEPEHKIIIIFLTECAFVRRNTEIHKLC